MNNLEVIAFASICVVSAFCIYLFDEKQTRRKKICKEVDEGIKNLKENVDSVIYKRVNVEK